MFTGIVERNGKVVSCSRGPTGLTLRIGTGFADLALGESVAVDGVCLTAEEVDELGMARFHVSEETLRRSTLGSLSVGDEAHLERALAAGARLSGHLVQGHVDAVARVIEVATDEKGTRLVLAAPPQIGRYLVEKGSVALAGVSLTVNFVERARDETHFGVAIIPHTATLTRLAGLRAGERVNLEADVLAKYVESLLPGRSA